MTDDATATGISEVGTVFVPVSDQDRSLDFFVCKLGFEKRADFAYGGRHRWIEVAPLGAVNVVALVPPAEGASAGNDVARCVFATADIEAATRPCVPGASTSTQKSRARARRGRGSSPPRCPSRIQFRRSSSSAIPTATAS